MNRKRFLTCCATLFLSVAAVGVGVAVSKRGNILSMNADSSYTVNWESEPTDNAGKLIMPGRNSGSEIEVKATKIAQGTGKVVSLANGGTFENVTGIGSIKNIALTYTVGTATANYDGSGKGASVLDVELGYYYDGTNLQGNIADERIAWTEKKSFGNNMDFSKIAAKPSFVRFTSKTAETINVNKISINYGCNIHTDIQDTLKGAYVVGEGSFIKNDAKYNAYGGVAMHNGAGTHDVAIDFKKGDKFTFKMRGAEPSEMHGIFYNLKTKDDSLYKLTTGDIIEIVADEVQLGISLTDDGNVTLKKLEIKTSLNLERKGKTTVIDVTDVNPGNKDELMLSATEFHVGDIIYFTKSTIPATPVCFKQDAVNNATVNSYITIDAERKTAEVKKDVIITFYIGSEIWPNCQQGLPEGHAIALVGDADTGRITQINFTTKHPNNPGEFLYANVNLKKGQTISFEIDVDDPNFGNIECRFKDDAIGDDFIKQYLAFFSDKKTAKVQQDCNITFYVGYQVWPQINVK